jgi:type III secretory pathway component EscU
MNLTIHSEFENQLKAKRNLNMSVHKSTVVLKNPQFMRIDDHEKHERHDK